MKQILYFSSTWCNPCKQLSPLMEKLQNEGKINYNKIDVDASSEMAAEYGIRNIPTLVLMENGNIKDRMVGMGTESTITNFYNG